MVAKNVLAVIGAFAILIVLVTLIIALIQALKEQIFRWKRVYQIKHRFNKPPTAKCYCIDCIRHDNKSKRCYKFDGWYTSDAWFCWDAEPCEKKEYSMNGE